MDAIECGGLWWLPEDTGRKVGGSLAVGADGRLRLSLHGQLGTTRNPLADKQYPIILGSVDKSPNGSLVTLTGSFLSGSTFGSVFSSREAYHVDRGYFGAHLTDQSDFAFVAMRLRLGGLDVFLHQLSGLPRQLSAVAKPGESVSLGAYTRHPVLQVDLPGGSVTVGFGLKSNLQVGEYTFREVAQAKVTVRAPISADDLLVQYGAPLRDLMTFVCDEPQPIDRLGVYLPEHPDHEILVIGALVQPDDTEKKQAGRDDLLFTLSDIRFPDFLPAWMRFVREHDRACNVYFGLLYGPPAYVDLTFQCLIDALQLYYARREEGVAQRDADRRRLEAILSSLSPADRQWLVDQVGAAPRTPLRVVLTALIERHGAALDPLIAARRDRFIDAVLGTAEFLRWREAEDEPASGGGAELYWLTQKVRFLLKACFLHEVGFAESEVGRFFARNPLFQHIHRMEQDRERTPADAAGLATPDLTASPDFDEVWGPLRGQSPHSRLVALGSLFDDRLGHLLGSPDESFRSKIETAFRRGLLSDNERQDLDTLRQLHDAVTHRIGAPELGDDEVRLVEGLKTWRIAVGAVPQYEQLLRSPHDRLLYVAAVIAARLKDRTPGKAPLAEPDAADVMAWPPVSPR